MSKKYWIDQEDPDKLAMSGFWRIVVSFAIVVAVCGVIGGAIWGVRVLTSDVRGAGEQTIKVNDADNRINSQQWFHDQLAQVRAADGKLDGAYLNVQAGIGTSDENILRTTYTGLLGRCIEMREQYNAEAKKVTREKWRDPALPEALDNSDPQTDCLPSSQVTSPTGSPR